MHAPKRNRTIRWYHYEKDLNNKRLCYRFLNYHYATSKQAAHVFSALGGYIYYKKYIISYISYIKKEFALFWWKIQSSFLRAHTLRFILYKSTSLLLSLLRAAVLNDRFTIWPFLSLIFVFFLYLIIFVDCFVCRKVGGSDSGSGEHSHCLTLCNNYAPDVP